MSSAVVVVSNFSELQVEDFAFEDTVVFIERVLQHKVRVQHVDVAEHLWGRGGGVGGASQSGARTCRGAPARGVLNLGH